MQEFNDNYVENIDDFPIAMAYVPWQREPVICEDLEEGFRCGTIFPNPLQEGDVYNEQSELYSLSECGTGTQPDEYRYRKLRSG